jgi:hypothetical protein
LGRERSELGERFGAFRCEPFIFVGAANDYAVMFQFLPAARKTPTS